MNATHLTDDDPVIDVPWTLNEKVFILKQARCKDTLVQCISFAKCLMERLKKSVFGTFLTELNHQQKFDPEVNENKLQILNWQLTKYNTHDLDIVAERNKMFRDYLENLKTGVTKDLEINKIYLEKTTNALFLDRFFLRDLDDTIHKFRNLTVLTLCGNYLHDINGSMLPRKLVFLELFDNFIADLKNFCYNLPKGLMHIGLGRNKLTDDSKFHLFHSSTTLPFLKSLDLSNNDIYHLKRILEDLQSIKTLTAFSLEGNPCWVIPEYKNLILINLPNLIYLDQIALLEEDRKNLNFEEWEPQVKFCGFRVMGLPEPPKDAKNSQIFYFEVNFPFLVKQIPKEFFDDQKDDQSEKEPEKSDKRSKKKGKDKPTKQKDEDKKNKFTKKTKNSDQSEGSSSKGVKKGKRNYYKGSNEYNAKEEKRNVWFKTERQKWAKTMEFPDILIESPVKEDNLKLIMAIRDTFRCQIEVKLIYLKVAPATLKKNQFKDPKQSKKSKKSDQINAETTPIDGLSEEIKENILKKSTIAYFKCNLESFNWSEQTLDFYWVDHFQVGEEAIKIDGSLKAIEYETDADQKKAQKKAKPSTKDLDSTLVCSTITPKETFPKILTCQVGIGLLRK